MSAAGGLLAFAGVMALGQFSPGPDMVLLTRTALREGAPAGVRTALGIACGLAVHATVAVAGLALVFDRLPVAAGILRWVAAVYLLWLAWQMVAERFAARWSGGAEMPAPAVSRRRPFVRGLLCNLLNPKAAIFLAAVCAPFLRGDHPAWWPAALWLIIVGQGGGLWSLWACVLQWRPLRDGYRRIEALLDGAFAAVLASLAVYLIVG